MVDEKENKTLYTPRHEMLVIHNHLKLTGLLADSDFLQRQLMLRSCRTPKRF